MTPVREDERSAIRWLTAQSVAFGVMAALLGIVANAMFLDEFGASWLPVTYLFIAGAGLTVSGAVARSARSGGLLPIATTVLAAAVVLFATAWLVAVLANGAWVAAPLLVLFPVLLQLGFVFLGGQAGRILDIAGIKATFPRIVAGFPVGAVIGGLLAGPLLALSGRPEGLILATTVAQAAFLGLVVVTGQRFAGAFGRVNAVPSMEDAPRPPLRQILGSRFVLLIIGYQVLSAVVSQLADFLVFDRASARYGDGEQLARFFARYTAAMNIVSILFLALLAGALLRRFGLRLGIAANPAVLTVLAAAMAVSGAALGPASLGLFAVVVMARIGDVALTDGTTRTSINAAYQVLAGRERLAVQTSVEGIGVPVAIGFSGVLLLVLDAASSGVGAIVIATLIFSAVWTWISLVLYQDYTRSLVRVVSRRPLLDDQRNLALDVTEEAAATRLLASGDEGEVRLGLDLLAAMSSPAPVAELHKLAEDSRREVRLAALEWLARAGDALARDRLAAEVSAASSSTDADERCAAARALGDLEAKDRASLSHLLSDPDPRVRVEAIGGVQHGDEGALDAVIEALADPRTCSAGASALERLGDAVVPAVAAVLAGAGCPAPPAAMRLVRAVNFAAPEAAGVVLLPHVRHLDRELGLTVLMALVRPEPATGGLVAELEWALDADARAVARTLAASVACSGELADDSFSPLSSALEDEYDLLHRRVAAGVTALHGHRRVGAALLALSSDDERSSLAVEALEVTLSRSQMALAMPVLRPGLAPSERLVQLPALGDGTPVDVAGWLVELISDPDDHWRSPWLRACALHTATRIGVAVDVDADELAAMGDPDIDQLLAERARG